MANQQNDGIQDADQLSGRDLQQSQATGEPGVGFARDQMQEGTGGEQMGGGPSQSDMAAPGGSSGSGGYGNAQNQAFHQGQQQAQTQPGPEQSRGEFYDEQQGGGRNAESVSQQGGSDPAENRQLDQQADALLQDQQQHQDRGQSEAEAEQQR